MSVDVFHLAINYIELNAEGVPEAHFRSDLITPTKAVNHLIEQLHLAYNSKPTKGYAIFSEQKDTSVALSLQQWQQDDSDFMALATVATNTLLTQLHQHQLAESGYLLVCHYRYLATEQLLFCLLNSKEHFSLTAELELASSQHLDIGRMQLAARIDLAEYQTGRQHSEPSANYISFIRGRAGRKVADFFLDFLGCESGTDARTNSKLVLTSVEQYLNLNEPDAEMQQETRKQVYSYCEERAKAGQDVVLKELSAIIDETADNFLQYCAKEQLEVAEQFPVEVKELKPLIKFNGQGGGLSIGFEQNLLGDRIQYDIVNDVLTIKGTPPNLRDQLQRFIQGRSAFEHRAVSQKPQS